MSCKRLYHNLPWKMNLWQSVFFWKRFSSLSTGIGDVEFLNKFREATISGQHSAAWTLSKFKPWWAQDEDVASGLSLRIWLWAPVYVSVSFVIIHSAMKICKWYIVLLHGIMEQPSNRSTCFFLECTDYRKLFSVSYFLASSFEWL
jgi:hypothetical protein